MSDYVISLHGVVESAPGAFSISQLGCFNEWTSLRAAYIPNGRFRAVKQKTDLFQHAPQSVSMDHF